MSTEHGGDTVMATISESAVSDSAHAGVIRVHIPLHGRDMETLFGEEEDNTSPLYSRAWEALVQPALRAAQHATASAAGDLLRQEAALTQFRLPLSRFT
jgi:hypothetical protein